MSKSVAVKWVLRCFGQMEASRKDLEIERTKLNEDEAYLSRWCVATKFKELHLPKKIHFSTTDSVVNLDIGDYEEVDIQVDEHSIEIYPGPPHLWDDRVVVVERVRIISVGGSPYNEKEHGYLDWYLNNDAECKFTCNAVADPAGEEENDRWEANYYGPRDL